MRNALVTELRKHSDRTWSMWRNAINNIPDAAWRRGDVDYLIPVRHACHVLETAEFYLGDLPADQYPWGSSYHGDWEGSPAEDLPDRATTLALLEKITAFADARLAAMTDELLLAPDHVFPWTGGTRLATMLYLLRHNQHHLGEMHAELRRRDIPRAAWQ